MLLRSHHLRAIALAAGVALLTSSPLALADPPSRVARLGYTTGPVSFSPAGEDEWVQAQINRPLTTADRLWAGPGGRTEVQIGGAMIRMNAETGMTVLNLDDRIVQLQLTQGTLHIRLRRLDAGQVFEVDTPNLAFNLRQPGEYRIDVEPDGSATTIVVRKGQGEVFGDGAAYMVDARQPYRFMGTGLREYEYVEAPRLDPFDRWASDRDRRYDASSSARYVSHDVIGYQDLDANGTWRVDATYGNVWTPNRVEAGWAPYRDGHWAWVDPWGWTWVDDAPWGFAVSHYGRWANVRGSWGWIPGPVSTRAYYAPALVAFVGSGNLQLSISTGPVGGVAWFPLGPREVYRPAYPVSRGYFENVNRSNTVVNTTVINNYYNNTNITNVVYANRQVPGAVVAVPTNVFIQSQPVSRAAVRVTREALASAPVVAVAPVAPTVRSVRGASAANEKPPARTFERPVVARTAPPAAPVGFAAQQPQLAAKPGMPLDDAARRSMKPSAAVPAPVVSVVARPQEAAPVMRPPRASQAAPQAQVAPRQGDPAEPVAPARAPREPADGRGNGQQRAQPATPSSTPPQRAVAPAAIAPQAAPASPGMRGASEKAPQAAVAPPSPSPSAMPASAPRAQPPQRSAQPVPATAPPPAPQASPQRSAQPSSAPPSQALPAPQTSPQRSAQPSSAPPSQATPRATVAQQPTQRARTERPDNVPAATQRAPAGAPVAAPPPVSTSAPATPKGESRGRDAKPVADAPSEGKKGGEDPQQRDDLVRKPRG